MSEENNGQSTGTIASPRLSRVVVIVIAAHVVVIAGLGLFTLLKGNTGAKAGAEMAAGIGETKDNTTASLPPAEGGRETDGGDVSPVTPDNTAITPAPTAPVPSWNITVDVPTQAQSPAMTRVETPAPVTGGGGTYTVRKGDTLYKIARQFNVSVAELKQGNGLVSDALKIGQVLKVSDADGGVAPAVADNSPVIDTTGTFATRPAFRVGTPVVTDNIPPLPAYQMYKIAPGDTLYKIARRFNTKPEAIARANNISDPSKLKVGVEIKVPLTARETARPVSPSALQDVNVARLPRNRN
ncbi:MAG: LysM peptidoglycan-binding domain-containing protein [Verrucomicrobiales bacterium]|jgi:LysM repeat protein|nr:LysM peptidoglycan-binding domain-containing protein [Verrucomicrobiales bacterium]